MADRRDPLAQAADGDQDLQGIATWEPRSLLDRALARYTGTVIRLSVVLLAGLLFSLEVVLIALQILGNPASLLVVVLFPISVVPALAIAGYVWYTDITGEPLLLLVATYVLGVVLATFPTVTNTLVQLLIAEVVPRGILRSAVNVLNYFLVVAPGEEAAKLGAVFLFAYWRAEFDTVVDGAVYGAVAGLGFATIENVVYIVQTLASTSGFVELVVGGGAITVARSLAGPGHVIWTGIAGYYLGLAKFNPEHRLPLAVKGLLVAVLLHGAYNSTLELFAVASDLLGLGLVGAVLPWAFIVGFHLLAFGYLFARLRRYRRAYAAASPGPEAAPVEELDGYEE